MIKISIRTVKVVANYSLHILMASDIIGKLHDNWLGRFRDLQAMAETNANIPTANDCAELPPLAGVAYAARCARRVQHLASRGVGAESRVLEAIEGGIQAAERYAESGGESEFIRVVQATPAFEGRSAVTEVAGVGDNLVARVANITKCALNVALCARTEPDPDEIAKCPLNVISTLAKSITLSGDIQLGSKDVVHAFHAVRADFEQLKHEAIEKRWSASTPVSERFFALHTDFDLENEKGRIIEIAPLVDERLMAFFRQHPDELLCVHPRRFEEIIAEVFDGFGFDVELTAATRDDGRDIIAVHNEPAKVKYLIECKRYSSQKKVGIAIVQRLHGVIVSEGASKGIVATTSHFSGPAMRHLHRHPFILEGRDFDGIVKWLDLYDRFKMATLLDI